MSEKRIARENRQMIKNDKGICLTNKDAQIFFDALGNPPKANKKLRNALETTELTTMNLILIKIVLPY